MDRGFTGLQTWLASLNENVSVIPACIVEKLIESEEAEYDEGMSSWLRNGRKLTLGLKSGIYSQPTRVITKQRSKELSGIDQWVLKIVSNGAIDFDTPEFTVRDQVL